MQFLQKKILFVVKSLHNVEATDFFTSQNEKKEKYGKIHISSFPTFGYRS